jgi:hypothetical protein
MPEDYSVAVQEVGTGRFVNVIEYHGGTDDQWHRACEIRDALHHLGLPALACAGPSRGNDRPEDNE